MELRAFLGNLRRLGFDVATAEQIDAHRLLLLSETPMELKYGLRMLICQTKEQQQLFNFIWEGLYSEDIEPEDSEDRELATNTNQGVGMQPGEDIGAALARFDSPYKGVARQLMQGNDRNAAAIMMRFIFANRDPETKETIMADVREILESLDAPRSLLEQLETQLRVIMEEYLKGQNIIRNPLEVPDIAEQPIISLQQSPQLNHALKVLGRKLATKHKRRQKGQRIINFRKTIRSNIQHGGVLLDLERTTRRVDRPNLFLMTDVSSSTLQATRLFLTIIWHAKEVFTDIRYFEFIGSCVEVTSDFRRAKSVQIAMNNSLMKWRRIVGGKENSDYYSAFKMFQKLAKGKLSARSTIIVLGDMRDWLGPWRDGKPMSAGILKEIRKKVKRFIVLNPESERLWDSGDSICSHCTVNGIEIYETTTLGQLIRVLLGII